MPALLPLDEATARSLVLDPPLTDAEFQKLCEVNDWFRFERTREGEILMHTPTGALTSDGDAEINLRLRAWWKTHRRGRVFESNGGFFLPDGSMLTPDASYVLPQKLKGLAKEDLTGFPYLCPDFIIELPSVSDSAADAQKKMERWIENGVTLGWLIEPYKKMVHIYEPGGQVSLVSGKAVHGKGPIEGFTLDLDELWRCYEI
jgi:Uma2 family endonuclease